MQPPRASVDCWRDERLRLGTGTKGAPPREDRGRELVRVCMMTGVVPAESAAGVAAQTGLTLCPSLVHSKGVAASGQGLSSPGGLGRAQGNDDGCGLRWRVAGRTGGPATILVLMGGMSRPRWCMGPQAEAALVSVRVRVLLVVTILPPGNGRHGKLSSTSRA